MARVATGGKTPEPSRALGSDNAYRPAELEASRNQLLSSSGAIDEGVRRSVESVAASAWGAQRPNDQLADALGAYVKPLALHAYKVHDGLIAALRDAGYSDDAVFEVTLVGAFGAALAAQEKLFEVLYRPPAT